MKVLSIALVALIETSQAAMGGQCVGEEKCKSVFKCASLDFSKTNLAEMTSGEHTSLMTFMSMYGKED